MLIQKCEFCAHWVHGFGVHPTTKHMGKNRKNENIWLIAYCRVSFYRVYLVSLNDPSYGCLSTKNGFEHGSSGVFQKCLITINMIYILCNFFLVWFLGCFFKIHRDLGVNMFHVKVGWEWWTEYVYVLVYFFPVSSVPSCFFWVGCVMTPLWICCRTMYTSISHRIHGAAIYGNMDPINIPPLC